MTARVESPCVDRRRALRSMPDASDPLARLRLRAGRELAVVNLASGGALVEAEGRLLPGTHVDVHVIGVDGRVLVRSRVVRAYVHRLAGDRILYRGALAFERHVDLGVGYAIPRVAHASDRAMGTSYP
jgi:hypothetical protein